MRPLTAAEAADLARVVSHPRFHSLDANNYHSPWRAWFCGGDGCGIVSISGRTLRACIKAAVRWCEENP